jgi:hypothetical protein
MSMQPWQPSLRPEPTRPDFRRPLLALVLLLVVAVGIVLLAQSFGVGKPAGGSPSPTAAAAATPQRGQGLGGPQPPTATRSAAHSAAQATDTPGVAVTPLSPAMLSLRALNETIVPPRDPYSLASRLRLKGETGLPHTTDRPPGDYAVGHRDVFNISDIQNRNYYTITATVRKVTDHAYWYMADREPVDQAALGRLAAAFESTIYPGDRAVFGSEWTPGVDNDPRITVLFAPLRGAGGSFSAADEYTRAVNPYSNEREMIYISTGTGWGGLDGTLAHEFQHMIHWHEHANQDIWLNEGAAVLAADLNGYEILGVDDSFMHNPNVQLNGWEPNPTQARANYGAAFLFLDYLRSHYGGDKIIRATIDAPQPGTDAVSAALASLGYADRFNDVVEKWALANLLDEQPGASAQYTYPKRDLRVSQELTIDHYPSGYSGQASQFGATYIGLDAPQEITKTLHVDFSGQPETGVIPVPAHSGSGIWHSNRGDLADTTMTRRFDLTGLQTATLDCYLWYDIEPDFDYAYAEASIDGGVTWDTLEGRFTSKTNPNGTNYGNAYSGKSADQAGAGADGWLHESYDLTPYAGKEILLRFEYITDDGYNVQGLAVDDISIPELGYTGDAETGADWQTDGFVRVDNKLPQEWYLAVVRTGDTAVDVRPIEVSSGEASFDIDGLGAGGPYTKATLVIMGLTPHIIQHPTYELSVRPAK